MIIDEMVGYKARGMGPMSPLNEIITAKLQYGQSLVIIY